MLNTRNFMEGAGVIFATLNHHNKDQKKRVNRQKASNVSLEVYSNHILLKPANPVRKANIQLAGHIRLEVAFIEGLSRGLGRLRNAKNPTADVHPS